MSYAPFLAKHGKMAAQCPNCKTYHWRDRIAFATFRKSDRAELCFSCADGGKMPRRLWELPGWGTGRTHRTHRTQGRQWGRSYGF